MVPWCNRNEKVTYKRYDIYPVACCAHVETVCLLLKVSTHKDMIFATARRYGDFKGQLEFPGGKIEAGETPQEALVREIKEELEATIKVGDLIDTIEDDYPSFHLSMQCFWCEVAEGELKLLEAEAARWLTKDELYDVQWLPADLKIVEKIDKSF